MIQIKQSDYLYLFKMASDQGEQSKPKKDTIRDQQNKLFLLLL